MKFGQVVVKNISKRSRCSLFQIFDFLPGHAQFAANFAQIWAKAGVPGQKIKNLKKWIPRSFWNIFYYNLTKFHQKSSILAWVLFENVILSNRVLKLKPGIFSKIGPISLKISQNMINIPYFNEFYKMAHEYLWIMGKNRGSGYQMAEHSTTLYPWVGGCFGHKPVGTQGYKVVFPIWLVGTHSWLSSFIRVQSGKTQCCGIGIGVHLRKNNYSADHLIVPENLRATY